MKISTPSYNDWRKNIGLSYKDDNGKVLPPLNTQVTKHNRLYAILKSFLYSKTRGGDKMHVIK
jgi:hypothetical protein